MKLTENKLRQLIREELSGFQLSRKYQKVADEAFEKASENPNVGLDHIRSMLHAAEGIGLELERSRLDRRDVKELLDAIIETQIIAKEIQDK